MKNRKYMLEIILGFAVIDCLNFLLYRGDPGFLGARLHPYWIIILLSSFYYGFLGGLFSSLVASLHITICLFGKIPSRTAIEAAIESGNFLLPIAFVLVGVFLGNLRQQQINKQKECAKMLAEKEDLLKLSNQKNQILERAQRTLETRIVGEATTVQTLYDAARKLEALDEASIYKGCLEIICDHYKVEKASIYLLEGNYYVLKSAVGWAEAQMAEAKVPCANSIMGIVTEKNIVVTVKDILSADIGNKYLSQYGQVLAMFPLRNENGLPIGVINIEKMDFLYFTKPNLKMIELVVDWVGRALSNKKLYDRVKAQAIWDETLGIYSFNYFEYILGDEIRRAKEFNLEFAVSLLKIDKFGFYDEKTQELISKTAVSILKKHLAETDKLFCYKFRGTFALISLFTKEKKLQEVFNKCSTEFKRVAGSEENLEGLIFAINEFRDKIKDKQEILAPLLDVLKLKK